MRQHSSTRHSKKCNAHTRSSTKADDEEDDQTSSDIRNPGAGVLREWEWESMVWLLIIPFNTITAYVACWHYWLAPSKTTGLPLSSVWQWPTRRWQSTCHSPPTSMVSFLQGQPWAPEKEWYNKKGCLYLLLWAKWLAGGIDSPYGWEESLTETIEEVISNSPRPTIM